MTANPGSLPMWTVYDHPTDDPDNFVARLWLIEAGAMHATAEVIRAPTLAEIRFLLPDGLARLPRQEGDDPVIVEVWF